MDTPSVARTMSLYAAEELPHWWYAPLVGAGAAVMVAIINARPWKKDESTIAKVKVPRQVADEISGGLEMFAPPGVDVDHLPPDLRMMMLEQAVRRKDEEIRRLKLVVQELLGRGN